MKAEDLFLAIGQAEDRHLAQSELESVRPSNKKEEPTLKPHKTFARIIRNILVAALLLSLLTMTAYAIGGEGIQKVVVDNSCIVLLAAANAADRCVFAFSRDGADIIVIDDPV